MYIETTLFLFFVGHKIKMLETDTCFVASQGFCESIFISVITQHCDVTHMLNESHSPVPRLHMNVCGYNISYVYHMNIIGCLFFNLRTK